MRNQDEMRARLAEMRTLRMRGFPRWAWWIIWGFPVLFLLAGVGMLVEAAFFVSEAESARGEVVALNTSRDSDGVSYSPVIRYRGADGAVSEGVTHIGSSEYNYAIGAPVDILYAPGDRDVVRIDSFFSIYGLGLIFTLISVVFLTMLAIAQRIMFSARDPYGGSVLARAEAEARERWRQEEEASARPAPPAASGDPYGYGHEHKPKPQRTPTVRRNR